MPLFQSLVNNLLFKEISERLDTVLQNNFIECRYLQSVNKKKVKNSSNYLLFVVGTFFHSNGSGVGGELFSLGITW